MQLCSLLYISGTRTSDLGRIFSKKIVVGPLAGNNTVERGLRNLAKVSGSLMGMVIPSHTPRTV